MLLPKKKFKAIIFDCDGTLIPNKRNGLPSKKVTEAITKISKLIHVGIATSRPLFLAVPIMKHLNLSGPSIVAAGAQIVDGETFKILNEKSIEKKDLSKAISIVRKFKLKYFLQDGISNDKEMTTSEVPDKAIEMAMMALEQDLAQELKDELSKISGISVHKNMSWEKGKADVVITHILATKHHGILEVARLLNINTHEIIGVGDGYNDFPLLMACGLKVAMGNAVDDLKAIADYVAPTVENDGVVDVINKFVL